jgi:hypothetical protein
MVIIDIFVSGFPGDSGGFDNNPVLEGWDGHFWVGDIQPCRGVLLHNFEPKDVLSLEGEGFIDVLELDIIFML